MAADEGRRHSTNRNRFLMLCVYAGAYLLLRHHGEVVVQNITLPAGRGGYSHLMVSPHPSLPYWRQQLWRGLFSLPMVIEEESNRAARKGQDMARSAQQMVSPNDNAYAQPARQQQYQAQPQYQQQPQRAASNPGLAPGEKLIYVAPPGQSPTPQYSSGVAARPQAASGNYPGLAPGEQLLYVAPPGESPTSYIDSGRVRR